MCLDSEQETKEQSGSYQPDWAVTFEAGRVTGGADGRLLLPGQPLDRGIGWLSGRRSSLHRAGDAELSCQYEPSAEPLSNQ